MFGGRSSDIVDAWNRLRDRVAELGRPVESFGGDYVVLGRKGAGEVADKIGRWREAGGTHASVVTMSLGLDSADAHIDYLASVAEALGR